MRGLSGPMHRWRNDDGNLGWENASSHLALPSTDGKS